MQKIMEKGKTMPYLVFYQKKLVSVSLQSMMFPRKVIQIKARCRMNSKYRRHPTRISMWTRKGKWGQIPSLSPYPGETRQWATTVQARRVRAETNLSEFFLTISLSAAVKSPLQTSSKKWRRKRTKT
jgi:hypothetical protein